MAAPKASVVGSVHCTIIHTYTLAMPSQPVDIEATAKY